MRNDLVLGLKAGPESPEAEWRLSEDLIPYEAAVTAMQARVEAILAGHAPELVWLLEHPPLYTSGTSARPEELLEPRFPVHATGRGGQFTYHGPGQRVAYLMLDLNRRAPDVRRYVATLEEWIIRVLARFGVQGERREDRVGVWVPRPDKGDGFEDKIAAIGDPAETLGQPARHRAQCRARPDALLRHSGLRRLRYALRRHQPARPRRDREHG